MEANCCGQLDYLGWCPWFDCWYSARFDKPIVYGGAGRNNDFYSSYGRWALCTEKKSLGFGACRLHLLGSLLAGYSGYYTYCIE